MLFLIQYHIHNRPMNSDWDPIVPNILNLRFILTYKLALPDVLFSITQHNLIRVIWWRRTELHLNIGALVDTAFVPIHKLGAGYSISGSVCSSLHERVHLFSWMQALNSLQTLDFILVRCVFKRDFILGHAGRLFAPLVTFILYVSESVVYNSMHLKLFVNFNSASLQKWLSVCLSNLRPVVVKKEWNWWF